VIAGPRLREPTDAVMTADRPDGGRPVRVEHVVLSLDVGGLERNVVNQVREADRLGQAADVVCLERPGALAARVEELGGRVSCFDKPPGLKVGLIARLAVAFRRSRPDVVHTHQVATLFYAATAARLAGVPLIVHTEHGKHYAGRPNNARLGRLGARHVARFYCLSRDMADEALAARVVPARKLRTIDNGIDLDRFRDPGDPHALRARLGIPADAPVIGTAGRLAEIKRQDILIRGFARLREHVPTARLVIVGDGPLRDDLAGLAATLGVGDAVHLVGYTADPQHYHHMFDVFAMTSRSEGTPQALIEAGVAGRPAVATRVGGVPEMVIDGENGFLIDPDDPDALADRLRRLVDDPGLRRRLGEAARSRAEARYDVRRMAEAYHRDYLELLGARR
jgi:glycosyltransferase involved in cell wall biosynthesis